MDASKKREKKRENGRKKKFTLNPKTAEGKKKRREANKRDPKETVVLAGGVGKTPSAREKKGKCKIKGGTFANLTLKT